MSKNIIPWNDNINLDNDTILLIFSTPTCPPCRALIPVLDQIDGMITNNQFKICKINCEELPSLANRFNIKMVPTIIFFHKGQMKNYNQSRDANSMYKWITSQIV